MVLVQELIKLLRKGLLHKKPILIGLSFSKTNSLKNYGCYIRTIFTKEDLHFGPQNNKRKPIK
jgi:hypothetical protein